MSRRLLLIECLLGLLMAIVARQLDRAARGLIDLPPARSPAERVPSVSAIVPARNEERNIARCLRSLLAQDYPALEVIAVDDDSTDRTGAVLAELAAEDARLRVVAGRSLPPGWVGKPWAAHQGAAVAGGEWLLFADADTVHRPGALSAAIALATARHLDLLSLAPGQELRSLAERTLLPGMFGIILPASGLVGTEQHNGRARALGQYLLIRREIYQAAGGHRAVGGDLVEDFRLARLVAAAGGQIGFAGGRGWVSARMYCSLGEVWHGFAKNLFPVAREQPALIPVGVFGIPALALLPFVLLGHLGRRVASGDRRPATLALTLVAGLQSLAVLGYGVAICRYLRLPVRYALAFPLGAIAFVAILLDSARRHLLGHPLCWKGRVYRRRQ